jgi:membrane protease YdiL (CAAX protease family)
MRLFERAAQRRTLSLKAIRIRHALRAYSGFAAALLVIVVPEFRNTLVSSTQKLSELLVSVALVSPKSTELCCYVLRFLLNIIAVLLIVRFWERRDYGSIGLSKPLSDDFFAGVAAWFLFDAILRLRIAYGRVIAAIGWSDIAPADLGFSSESWLLAFIASDVIFEELATRAYIIERLRDFTGSKCLGAIGSLLLSVAMHIPGSGFREALLRMPMLALFTGLYLWRRSVVACALSHFLLDAQLYVLLFNVPFLGQWFYKPRYTVMLLAGEGLIYCAVRWRRRTTHRPGALLPAASE